MHNYNTQTVNAKNINATFIVTNSLCSIQKDPNQQQKRLSSWTIYL